MIRLGLNVANFGPAIGGPQLVDWARFADSNGLSTAVLHNVRDEQAHLLEIKNAVATARGSPRW